MTTTTPPEQTTLVLNPSLEEFLLEVIDLAKDGWEFDEENPPRVVMWNYEAHMWRNPTDIQRAAQPKLSRAESLALARAAKAAKAAAGEQPAETPATTTDDSPY